MRMTSGFIPTLRETPAEAEIPSHKLMLRAGFLRRAAAGIYTYLPLSHRVLMKIMQIIREEMNAAGGQEILLPIVQPAELWHATGRWADYGDEMFRLKDRHGREFCLGPTHEEIITSLVQGEVSSYRQLPLLLYQIQNKYRDEIRPRFGIMRGREFIMKDLYSFDVDQQGLDESYQKMYRAYNKIFSRCGLETKAVLADSGAIGGSLTHEFVVLADCGEAIIVYCTECDYAANVEKAECQPPLKEDAEPLPLEKASTPGQKTIEQVASFLGAAPSRLIKTLLYKNNGEVVAALVRGDHELNEVKLARILGTLELEPADEETILRVTGAPVGYCGPVGLKNVRLIVDHAVAALANGVAGANEEDAHLLNVNMGRDYQPDMVADIRLVKTGDPCPQCGSALLGARGIEVGQVFQLGTKYSEALRAYFLDEKGEQKPIVMGCYGIGVTRTMAAIIEQHHDEHGIIWPMSVAPFHVHIVPLGDKELTLAEELYDQLTSSGIEVLLDDRDERPGVKFKDADLIGIPIRITIGARSLSEGKVELRLRSGESEGKLAPDEVYDKVRELIASKGA
jgi:prolyl-tRNA synthetase